MYYVYEQIHKVNNLDVQKVSLFQPHITVSVLGSRCQT